MDENTEQSQRDIDDFREVVSETFEDFEEEIDNLKTDVALLKNGSLDDDVSVRNLSELFAKHKHLGFDRTQKIETVFPITAAVQGISAATAGYYGTFWQNHTDKKYFVTAIKETHAVAGSDPGTVTLQVERLQGTEAKDAGDDLLTTAFNLKGTANTNSDGSLTGTLENLTLESGDRLGLVTAGTLTAVDHVCVTVYLQQA